MSNEKTWTVRELIEELEKLQRHKEVVVLAAGNRGVFTIANIRDCLQDEIIFIDVEAVLF